MKWVMFSTHRTTKGKISHSFSDLFLKSFCFISHVVPRKQVEQRSGGVCENVNTLFPAWVTAPLRGLQTDVQTCSYLSGFAVWGILLPWAQTVSLGTLCSLWGLWCRDALPWNHNTVFKKKKNLRQTSHFFIGQQIQTRTLQCVFGATVCSFHGRFFDTLVTLSGCLG